jgi:hypothetical protein
MAQTRTVASAIGTPRVLNTMSSLREPWPCAVVTTAGQRCNANAKIAQIIPLTVLNRIIALLFSEHPDRELARSSK